jgi:hypothetical protein
MMVVPRDRHVRLTYARGVSDHLGLALSFVTALALAVGGRWRQLLPRKDRVPAPAPARVGFIDACDLPPATRRWGGLIPLAVLLLLVVSRFLAGGPAGSP